MPKYAYTPVEFADGESARKFSEKLGESDSGEPAKIGCFMLAIHFVITCLCFVATILFFPFVAFFAIKLVRQHERLVIFRLGILQRERKTGLTLVLPCIDVCHRVDMRTRAFSVPPRQIRVRDQAMVELGCEVQFQIDDAVRCILNVTDLNGSLRVLAQTALINRVSRLRLEELECGRDDCAKQLVTDLNESARLWGVTLRRCEISQLKLISAPASTGPASTNTGAAPGMMLPPAFGAGANAGGRADMINQLMQHFLPNFMQSPGMANRPASSDQSVQLNAGGMQQSAIPTDIASLLQPPVTQTLAPAQAQAQATTPAKISSKIDSLIQIAQRALIDDASLRVYLNALYLFKIFPGSQLTGTPIACYMLDAKTAVPRERELPADFRITIDCSISISEIDVDALFEGRLNTWQAFLQGRVQVEGDMNAALRLTELLDRLKAKT